MFEKLVVVTRKTRLQELVARFNTRMQARFCIEHAGGDFSDYEEEDANYEAALAQIRQATRLGLKTQFIERALLPTYVFSNSDLVIVVGPDGLVANAAKYVGSQPIIGINPDPLRHDGILVGISPAHAGRYVEAALEGRAITNSVTLAEVCLDDGQKLLAFNDLYVGARSHVSARYRMRYHNKWENQSSSGLIVSTGAGSTGWLSSIFNMVGALGSFVGGTASGRLEMRWDDPALAFVVREPFVSKHSAASIVCGFIQENEELTIESTMTGEGTIFSDGLEHDFLEFNAGATARIRKAQQQACLVMPPSLGTR